MDTNTIDSLLVRAENKLSETQTRIDTLAGKITVQRARKEKLRKLIKALKMIKSTLEDYENNQDILGD